MPEERHPKEKQKEIEELVTKFLLDIAALGEHEMRLKLLARRLAALEPEDAARALAALYGRGLGGPGGGIKGHGTEQRAVHVALAALVDHESFRDAVGHDRCRRIYLASIKLGFNKVSRLFTDLPPRKTGVHGYDKEEEAKMEFITLGQRRSMAKTSMKDTLDRLLSDPDPVVIEYVLNNPRITEREVLKVASKRPNSPQILNLIARHRRWSRRGDVIKAIVQNPFTSPRTSIALLEFMLSQDLKAVVRDKTLHRQVKQGAMDLLEERGEEGYSA